MGDPSSSREALTLLGEVYRTERTGVLSLEAGGVSLRVALRNGQIAGICPPPGAPTPPAESLPDPDDSTKLKLNRVLAEIGLGRARESSTPPAPPAGPSAGPSAGELREQLLSLLADGGEEARFEETGDLPEDTLAATGATEPLILEAVRRVSDPEAVRGLLGDLDRRLAATTALAEERTLTLTEGYLLSRMDGLSTAGQILQIVPLDSDETERSLAGLLLTGRVRYQLTPVPSRPRTPPLVDPAPSASPPSPGAGPANPEPAPEAARSASPAPEPPVSATPEPAGQVDPEAQARRRELIELFQSLPRLNHFEILGIEPGCDDAEVKRAHVALVKRYHPDTQRDPALADLHDVLEAIFIRVGESWEVLGNAKSRSAYESRLRSTARSDQADEPGPEESVAPEETLREAQQLLGESRYWDAIQMLESAVPRLQPRSHQHRGRILLARAYARNPKWIRKAEETLQRIVREDPANAEAHYELGVLYKARGLTARAQAMFRKAVELRPDYRRAAAEIGPEDTPPAGGFLRRLFKGGGA